MQPDYTFSGFAKYLAEEHLLDFAAIKKLTATNTNETLITKLIAANILDELVLAKSIANYFSLPLVDVKELAYSSLPLDTVQPEIIQKYRILPFAKKNEQLYLALSDPTDTTALNMVKFHTSLKINLAVAPHKSLNYTIEKIFQQKKYNFLDDEDAPIIKFIDQVLNDAIVKHASDIHFEPYEKFFRIRFRIDGLLYEITKTDANLSNKCSTRLKIMSNLDIAEKRLPQDGRFTFKLQHGQTRDCRISTCPTIFGEKLVIRILNPINTSLDIKHLDLTPKEQKIFCDHIQSPQGMILVTGPTGSGKTVTLYTVLNFLNQITKNILTIEDPVEINLLGINQVEVNHKANLDFSIALRAFLRQDPDIIMIGEIRDLETAEIAVKAAHTGHLVLATLHTSSASSSLTRLLNMGIPAFNLASALNLIIAQRLIRKLCSHCKHKQTLTQIAAKENNLEENIEIYSAKGCEHCNHGYAGRMPIFEIVPITKKISEMILEHCNTIEIEKEIRKLKILSLRETALNKVREGITSLEEINRVII